MRNGWKRGKYLIIDEESGVTRYSDQVKRDYTGSYVTKRFADYEQPQDFIFPLKGPKPIPFANPSDTNFIVDVSASPTVGNTNVPSKCAPASHLFRSDC